jgi:hypothetical protein
MLASGARRSRCADLDAYIAEYLEKNDPMGIVGSNLVPVYPQNVEASVPRRRRGAVGDTPLARGADSSARPGTREGGQTRRRPMDARGIHHTAPTRMP